MINYDDYNTYQLEVHLLQLLTSRAVNRCFNCGKGTELYGADLMRLLRHITSCSLSNPSSLMIIRLRTAVIRKPPKPNKRSF